MLRFWLRSLYVATVTLVFISDIETVHFFQRPTEDTVFSYGRKQKCRRNYMSSFGWNQNHAETVITVSAHDKTVITVSAVNETETEVISLYWTLFNTSISAEWEQLQN